MLFTLEALRAKKGDALLLHIGDPDDPNLVVIDGGPSGVYKQSLEPRLKALRKARTPDDELPIDLMMISHVDDDHIKGILDLTHKLVENQENDEPKPYKIRNLWHNSFDDIVGKKSKQLEQAALKTVGVASTDGTFPSGKIGEEGGLVLASVPQGRDLRNDAKFLKIKTNAPVGGLITTTGEDTIKVPRIKNLELQVLGPNQKRIDEFQEDWDKKLEAILKKEADEAEAAAYLDKSVYNLASIVVLAHFGGKTMLLTGDGRGDDILDGAREAGLLDDGPLHLDILKMPHHGSSNNIDVDFFESFTADHYVISGDGSHGNPRVDTFGMLLDSRKGDDRPFTIHLTYEPKDYKAHRGHPYALADLEKLLEKKRKAKIPFTIATPAKKDLSIRVDLLDPFVG